ncbi:hypothetical protein [Marinicella meishanensis]|uniref:hypothetical protein n=1 Tax=Marinicella meishanensis TaxID=2873263 RepID=UPI001CBD6DC3|nr:hypothetical protein [Marinicella sp. NBU2979]
MKIQLFPTPIRILCLCLLTTVVTAEESLPQSGLDEVQFNVVMVNHEGESMTLDPAFLSHAVFNFPVISGGVFGSPDAGQDRQLLFADDQNQIKLDLKAEQKRIAKAAKKLQPRFQELGLKVDSKRTKLVRLGTFAYHLQNPEYVAGIAVAPVGEPETLLILVYFDRRAELTGDIVLGGELYQHQISIPKKGFYWIEVDTLEAGMYQLKRAPNHRQVELVISVAENQAGTPALTALQ